MAKLLLPLILLLPNLFAADKNAPVYVNPVEAIYPVLPTCKKFSSDGCCKPSGTITIINTEGKPAPDEPKKSTVKNTSKKKTKTVLKQKSKTAKKE